MGEIAPVTLFIHKSLGAMQLQAMGTTAVGSP